MQYKIPVQIENEDPILLGLSLRQLMIIMAWWAIWYAIFKPLAPILTPEIAAVPALIPLLVALIIALFKQHWMTFVPFLLAVIKFNITYKERRWIQWVDSYSPMDIWYLFKWDKVEDENIDFKDKLDKMKEMQDKLSKI